MVTLNGTDIHYEVYGKGEPLFLLHGFTQSAKSWLPFVSDYASDMSALVTYLKLDRINTIGYSYGGDVLFQLALL